jgi:2-iminobutanoate/2-iminopropanoate deaminase
MKRVKTEKAPEAVGPYSQGVAAGGFLFTAGQVALTPDGTLITESIEAEIRQIMNNLQAILHAAGCDFAHVVKSTVYITDLEVYKTVNAVYGAFFTEGEAPARECVGVSFLPLPDARVEISMIAQLPAMA